MVTRQQLCKQSPTCKIVETVFCVHPTAAPVNWLDSDHVICVYCRSMSVPGLYNESRKLTLHGHSDRRN
jgi:hypothetical protein